MDELNDDVPSSIKKFVNFHFSINSRIIRSFIHSGMFNFYTNYQFYHMHVLVCVRCWYLCACWHVQKSATEKDRCIDWAGFWEAAFINNNDKYGAAGNDLYMQITLRAIQWHGILFVLFNFPCISFINAFNLNCWISVFYEL